MIRFETQVVHPLPAAPPNTPFDLITAQFPEGFVLWGGERGPNAKVYMARQDHPDYLGGILRFFGRSAVLLSGVSPLAQSLIWTENYLGPDLKIDLEEAIASYTPLVYLIMQEVGIRNNPPALGLVAVGKDGQPFPGVTVRKVPSFQPHGILHTDPVLLTSERLEEVGMDANGRLVVTSGRLFNNGGIVLMLRHILKQVTGTGPMEALTLLNPKYTSTPISDTA